MRNPGHWFSFKKRRRKRKRVDYRVVDGRRKIGDMLTTDELSSIKERNTDNPDVTALLAELELQRERQNTAIGWISRDALPAMKQVWRYLLYQKKTPPECLMLDNAIAQLEGDLGWLWMGNSR
jgi:hypothetical protein